MLLTSQEVAARIRKSVSWLNHARQTGVGPRYLKIGHQVRYRPEDVEAWLEAQARTSVWDFEAASPRHRAREADTAGIEAA